MVHGVSLVSIVACALLAGKPLQGQVEQAGSLVLGSASGVPGEEVRVSIHASFPRRLYAWFAVFEFDAERLEYLRYEVTGSDAAHVDQLSVGHRTYPQPGEGAFGVHATGLFTPSTPTLLPGDNVHLGFLRFRIRAIAPSGPTPVRLVRHISSTAGGPEFSYIAEGGGFLSGTPEHAAFGERRRPRA